MESKEKTELDLSSFLYKKPMKPQQLQENPPNQPKRSQIQRKKEEEEDVFNYFYNLF